MSSIILCLNVKNNKNKTKTKANKETKRKGKKAKQRKKRYNNIARGLILQLVKDLRGFEGMNNRRRQTPNFRGVGPKSA